MPGTRVSTDLLDLLAEHVEVLRRHPKGGHSDLQRSAHLRLVIGMSRQKNGIEIIALKFPNGWLFTYASLVRY